MKTIEYKKVLLRSLLALSIGAVSSSLMINKKLDETSETVAKVNSITRLQLYNQEIIPGEPIIFDKNRVDTSVTHQKLRMVEHLNYDKTTTSDISDIQKCPNLKKLSIFNAELLTNEDIAYINSTDIEELILYINNIHVNREFKLDIDRFLDKKVTIYFTPTHEKDMLVLVNMIKNLEHAELKIYGKYSNLDDYYFMDAMLDGIIESLDIKERDSDTTKLFKILYYVQNRIYYDPEVRLYLYGGQPNPVDLVSSYNQKDISSVLLGSSETIPGVCINYANLTDILLYKVGIKARTISGWHDQVSHQWNVLYLDGERYYVDPTNLDYFEINDLLQSFINGEDVEEKLISRVLDNVKNNSFSNYTFYEKLSSLDQERILPDVYYNSSLEGKKVYTESVPVVPICVDVFGLAITLEVSYELIRLIIENRKVKKIRPV